MYITKIISQIRRDLRVDYQCEHCGHQEKNASAYDDSYFHEKVIPAMVCTECGEKAPDTYKPREPKHPDGVPV